MLGGGATGMLVAMFTRDRAEEGEMNVDTASLPAMEGRNTQYMERPDNEIEDWTHWLVPGE